MQLKWLTTVTSCVIASQVRCKDSCLTGAQQDFERSLFTFDLTHEINKKHSTVIFIIPTLNIEKMPSLAPKGKGGNKIPVNFKLIPNILRARQVVVRLIGRVLWSYWVKILLKIIESYCREKCEIRMWIRNEFNKIIE